MCTTRWRVNLIQPTQIRSSFVQTYLKTCAMNGMCSSRLCSACVASLPTVLQLVRPDASE